MPKRRTVQNQEELKAIQEASQRQALPEQKRVFSVSEKIRRRVHNLPDPTRPPLGYDEHKAFDRVFPYVRLPRLHPPNQLPAPSGARQAGGDTVIFNAPELPANQLILGDNLEVLRTLPPECIDLIYIDPPFFSGRTYNVIGGDTNEVRTFYDIWEGGIDSYLIWLVGDETCPQEDRLHLCPLRLAHERKRPIASVLLNPTSIGTKSGSTTPWSGW